MSSMQSNAVWTLISIPVAFLAASIMLWVFSRFEKTPAGNVAIPRHRILNVAYVFVPFVACAVAVLVLIFNEIGAALHVLLIVFGGTFMMGAAAQDILLAEHYDQSRGQKTLRAVRTAFGLAVFLAGPVLIAFF